MLTQNNKLFTCPHVEEGPLKRVLDAGCGTGIWSIDFGRPRNPIAEDDLLIIFSADDHPDTQVCSTHCPSLSVEERLALTTV